MSSDEEFREFGNVVFRSLQKRKAIMAGKPQPTFDETCEHTWGVTVCDGVTHVDRCTKCHWTVPSACTCEEL